MNRRREERLHTLTHISTSKKESGEGVIKVEKESKSNHSFSRQKMCSGEVHYRHCWRGREGERTAEKHGAIRTKKKKKKGRKKEQKRKRRELRCLSDFVCCPVFPMVSSFERNGRFLIYLFIYFFSLGLLLDPKGIGLARVSQKGPNL